MRPPALKLERLASLIVTFRGERVLLSEQLAPLYGVTVSALKQAVRRNIERFPADFMFQLTAEVAATLLASRSQNVILKRGQNFKYLPYAFTEQGVAMLSSVLRTPSAVEVNIAIMRAFVQLRRLMDANRDLARSWWRATRPASTSFGSRTKVLPIPTICPRPRSSRRRSSMN